MGTGVRIIAPVHSRRALSSDDIEVMSGGAPFSERVSTRNCDVQKDAAKIEDLGGRGDHARV